MVYTRHAQVPQQSFFLLGIRGVGKSTWAKQALPDALRLDLLDEALFADLLAVQLPAFEAKLRSRERRRPKLYWADPGLVRAIKRQLGAIVAEERGALLEGWVLGQLRAHNEHQHIYDDIGYWSAAEAAVEVDFMLTRDRQHLALEVKAAQRYNTTMLKGLRAVADLDGLNRRILIYRGQRAFRTGDNIEVWPIEHLHEALRTDQFWR